MELSAFELTPDTYNPNGFVQWADLIDNQVLPAGKFYIPGRGKIWTPDRLYAKGATQLSKFAIADSTEAQINLFQNQGLSYDDVAKTNELLNLPNTGQNEWVGVYPDQYNKMFFPNGFLSYQQGYEKGLQANVAHRVVVGETMENNHYAPDNIPMWEGYYDAKSPRMDARFGAGNWLMGHDYLHGVCPNVDWLGADTAKGMFRNASLIPGYSMLNGAVRKTNLSCFPIYLGSPDRIIQTQWRIAFAGMLNKHVGKKFVVFPETVNEWRPNIISEILISAGKFYNHGALPLGSAICMAVGVLGMYWGDGLIGWGFGGKATQKLWRREYQQPGDWWTQTGDNGRKSMDSFPNYTTGDYSYPTGGGEDAFAFGVNAYNKVLAPTAGGVRKFAKYKIDNGDWINPVNQYADDIVTAAYAQSLMISTEVKNGIESVLISNPNDNNKPKKVTFIGQNGQEHYMEVCTPAPHMAKWSI